MKIVIDTETTGLGKNAEILQLTILDYDGNVIFDEYFKPDATEWPQAEKVNHISPQDVDRCMPIGFYREKIQNILDCASSVIGYNVAFDIRMLMQSHFKVQNLITEDVCAPFRETRKEGEPYNLSACAKYYNYVPQGAYHNALYDTQATLYCYKKMLENGVFPDMKEILNEED